MTWFLHRQTVTTRLLSILHFVANHVWPFESNDPRARVRSELSAVLFFVAELVLGRHRADHLLEQFEVMVGVPWRSVARAQHGGQGLFGVVAPHANGLNPKPRLYVAAASSFSECTLSKVESKSQIIGPTGGSAAQTRARAWAKASGIARSSETAVACIARQAVATDATGPKRSSCSLSAARSAKQSAPSAMATASG
jgi:hypothetical protein